jgi:hypothetical protein
MLKTGRAQFCRELGRANERLILQDIVKASKRWYVSGRTVATIPFLRLYTSSGYAIRPV